MHGPVGVVALTNDKLNQCTRIEGKGKIIPGAVRVYPLPALSPTHLQDEGFPNYATGQID